MKRPTSLTLRLTLLFTAAAMVGFLAFGWIIGRSIENHFDSEDIEELKVAAQAVAESFSTLKYQDGIAQIKQRLDDILVGHHGASLLITDTLIHQERACMPTPVQIFHQSHCPHPVGSYKAWYGNGLMANTIIASSSTV